jgi:hypothetical protein
MTTPQPQDLAVALVAICVGGAAILTFAAPVAADDHGIVYGPVDALQDNGVDVSDSPLGFAEQSVAATIASVRGGLARLSSEDDGQSVAEAADTLRTNINDNSGEYESYINARVDATEDRDVLAVTLDGDSENTTYVTADVTNGSYTNLTATGSTDRTVDVECTLSGDLATRADDELERFHEEFVTTDEDVSGAFVSRMGTRYDGSLRELCTEV